MVAESIMNAPGKSSALIVAITIMFIGPEDDMSATITIYRPGQTIVKGTCECLDCGCRASYKMIWNHDPEGNIIEDEYWVSTNCSFCGSSEFRFVNKDTYSK
jgi:hypothetical protein